MSEPDQSTSTNDGYIRPFANWRCGHAAAEGRCQNGPTAHGRCPGQQCAPLHTARWYHRQARQLIAMLTLGVLLIILISPYNREFLAPGPLTSSHAQLLLDRTHGNRCAACHVSDQLTPSHPAPNHEKLLVSTPLVRARSQTELCQRCHLQQMPELEWGQPHDLKRSQLEGLAQHIKERGDASKTGSLVSWLPAVDWHQTQLECSDCHSEHHGHEHNLQAIASDRCQSCHQRRFVSFSNGHPEFQDYPYHRDRTIRFDHTAHRDRHFPKKQSTFDCRHCHLSEDQKGAVGRVFRSLGFEQSCGTCHDAAIQNSVTDGLVVFQLPSLDKTLLSAKKGAPDHWPEEASQVLDGDIHPLMLFLLASDPELEPWRTRLMELRRLNQLDVTDENNAALALAWARASQTLLSKLAERGQPAWSDLLRSSLSMQQPDMTNSVSASPSDIPKSTAGNATSPTNHAQRIDAIVAGLTRGVPPDLFRTAYQSWFERSQSSDARSVAASPTSATAPKSAQSNDLTASKDPPASDALLASDDLLAPASSPQASSAASDDLLAPGSSDANTDLLTGSPLISNLESPTKKPSLKAFKGAQHVAAGGWYIDQQRLAIVYIPTGHADLWLTQWLSLAAAQTGETARANDTADANNRTHANDAPNAADRAIPNNTDKLSSKNLTSLALRPLLDNKSLGQCTQCHQLTAPSVLDGNESLAGFVGWKANRQPSTSRPLTRFDHAPHLTQPHLAQCTHCHELEGTVHEESPGSQSRDRLVAAINKDIIDLNSSYYPIPLRKHEFQAMQRDLCAACHKPHGSSEACTLCHNYHVNQTGWLWNHR